MNRRSKEQWLSLFQQQTDSGLSAAEFCKQQGLCDKHFSLRKKQLLPSTEAFVRVVKPSPLKTKTVLPENKINMQCRIGSCLLQFESVPDAVWLSQLIKALS